MDVIPKCCMVFKVSWPGKLTNKELYGNLPPAQSKVGFRRLKLAGHSVRHPEEEASKLVLWQPMNRRMNMGRPEEDSLKDNLKEG